VAAAAPLRVQVEQIRLEAIPPVHGGRAGARTWTPL
jgi:hypothetical protein